MQEQDQQNSLTDTQQKKRRIRELPEEKEKEIVEKYKNGSKKSAIIKEFKIQYTKFYKIMKKYEIPVRDESMPVEIEKEIVEKYKNGSKKYKIVKDYNIQYPKLYEILSKYGIAIEDSKRKKITPEQEKEIIDKYNNKIPIKKIIEEYKIKYPKMYKILDENGISSPGKKSRITPEQEKEIVEKFKNGITKKQLREEYKTTYPKLKKILDK
jgi:uncharacterized protein (DUF433 family)